MKRAEREDESFSARLPSPCKLCKKSPEASKDRKNYNHARPINVDFFKNIKCLLCAAAVIILDFAGVYFLS
jgi:hypothetical protein